MNYTSSVPANERLASISDSRYSHTKPSTISFNGAVFISEPSTINVIQACDTLKSMCVDRPHYLSTDTANAYSKLLECILSMKYSHDRRVEEDFIAETLHQKQDNAPTRITKVKMGMTARMIAEEAEDNEAFVKKLEAELDKRKIQRGES